MSGAAKEVLRTMKNVTKGYSDLQILVREATSNDPTNAPTKMLYQIARHTYSDQDFAEILYILRKRLNDNGKNWLHVLKSLVVVDYIIRHGASRTADYMKRHIVIIKTLCDFQHISDCGTDCGLNVRALARKLTNMLENDDEIKIARLKAKDSYSKKSRIIGGQNSELLESNNIVDSSESSNQRQLKIDESYLKYSNTATTRRPSSPISVEKMSEEEQLNFAIELSKIDEEKRINKKQNYERFLYPENVQTISSRNSHTPPPQNHHPCIDLLGEETSINSINNKNSFSPPEKVDQINFNNNYDNFSNENFIQINNNSINPNQKKNFNPPYTEENFNFNKNINVNSSPVGFSQNLFGSNPNVLFQQQSVSNTPLVGYPIQSTNPFLPKQEHTLSGPIYQGVPQNNTIINQSVSKNNYNLPIQLVDLDNLGKPKANFQDPFSNQNNSSSNGLTWISNDKPTNPISNLTLAQLQAKQQQENFSLPKQNLISHPNNPFI